jgi:hypothetical protein
MPLMETLGAALEATALSQALRASIWLYPLVNIGHVVGIALLFGAIATLDLRLLGCWKGVSAQALAQCLVPVAVAGLLLAAATGSLQFLARPLDYVGDGLFGLKMGLLSAAVLNALVLRRALPWRPGLGVQPVGTPLAWRFAGGSSLLLWLAVIAAGRLIGYR